MKSLSLFVALRYSFGHHRGRLSRFISMLSGAGLVLGVAMMITVLSVMNGFDRELRDRILVIVPHVKLFSESPMDDWQVTADRVRNEKNVLSVHPYTELEVLARKGGKVEPMLLYAVDPEVEVANGFGELLGDKPLRLLNEPGEGILLGAGLASQFNLGVGDSLSVLLFEAGSQSLKAARFTIKEILRTGTEADQRLGIVSLAALPKLEGQSSQPRGLRIQTDQLFGARELAYRLFRLVGDEYRAATWAMTHGNLYQAVQMSRYMVSLIMVLILAIAAFNLIATLMIASADKQNELAVLKTMGATPKTLSRIFALQGLIVGLIGTGVGTTLGLFLSSQISKLANLFEQMTGQALLNSEVYPLDYLPSDIQYEQVVLVALVAIVLSVIAALYPALKVSKVDAAQVLRYE